jgi:flagellar hook-length control protein FliK
MQAVSISNAVPASVAVSAAASLSAQAIKPSSPFAALFQTQLRAASGTGNLPAPGKPKDSARPPDVATPTSNSPQIAWQQLALAAFPVVPSGLEPSIPATGTAESGATSQGPFVATASTPSAPFLPAVNASQNDARPGDPVVLPMDLKTPASVVPPVGRVQGSATFQGSTVATASTTSATSFPVINSTPGSTHAWDFAVAPVDLQTRVFEVSPAGGMQGGVISQDSRSAPANTPDVSLGLSGRTNAPSTVVVPPAGPSIASLDANPGPQSADGVPTQSGLPSLPSTEAPQMPSSANAPQSGGKTAAPNIAGVPCIQALQDARSGLEFMNLQTAGGAQVSANPAVQIPPSSIPGNATQLGSKVQMDTAAGNSVAPVQAATKTMAIGVPTPSFHDSLQSQAINNALSVPNVAVTSKPQSKDTSSRPQGNDTNTTSDHTLNSAVAHANGNGFVQSLDTARVNAGNAQPVPTNSTVVAADIRVPVEPRSSSMDPKSGAGNTVPMPQGQSLSSASAADQPTVSGARLTDHPGQTEIHIEMQAGSLGVVELRAHISGDQIGASIAVEHHDAQVMLTNDLPALHNALAEKNLHFNTLSVSQGMGSSMGGGLGSDAGQRGFVPSHPKVAYVTQEEISMPVPDARAEPVDASYATTRLSVRA